MTVMPEEELVKRCRRGEAAAWDDLFDRHYAGTVRFVFQLSPDVFPEDAEEIAQETFLSVVQNIGSFQGASRLQTWIFRIASNKTRDHLAKQRAAKRGGGAATVSLQAENPETGLAPDPPCRLPGPDQRLAAREEMELLGRALEQTGDPCREVIELRYFADLSYEEIAAALALNVKTVSSRLSKCLDRLEKAAARLFDGKKTSVLPSN